MLISGRREQGRFDVRCMDRGKGQQGPPLSTISDPLDASLSDWGGHAFRQPVNQWQSSLSRHGEYLETSPNLHLKNRQARRDVPRIQRSSVRDGHHLLRRISLILLPTPYRVRAQRRALPMRDQGMRRVSFACFFSPLPASTEYECTFVALFFFSCVSGSFSDHPI